MQVYYILDDEGQTIAIFKDEDFARDYLYHLGLDEEYCRLGVLSNNIFMFEQHDAKYHTLEDSSLKVKSHYECSRFKRINDDIGYCFFRDEPVYTHNKACSAIKLKKEK